VPRQARINCAKLLRVVCPFFPPSTLNTLLSDMTRATAAASPSDGHGAEEARHGAVLAVGALLKYASTAQGAAVVPLELRRAAADRLLFWLGEPQEVSTSSSLLLQVAACKGLARAAEQGPLPFALVPESEAETSILHVVAALARFTKGTVRKEGRLCELASALTAPRQRLSRCARSGDQGSGQNGGGRPTSSAPRDGA
jgi:hypothetical protein